MFFAGVGSSSNRAKENQKEMRFKEAYFLFFVLLLMFACHPPTNSLLPVVYRWPVMGTFYEVNWINPNSNQEELSKKMFEMVRLVDEKVSTYKSQSDLSKLNSQAGGHGLFVDQVTKELLQLSIKYQDQSEGYFNVAVGALVKLWKLNEPLRGEQREIPSPINVERVLNVVGKTKIHWQDQEVSINPKGAYLDMGAIAKGYALDKAYELSIQSPCGFMNLGRQLMMVGGCKNPLQFGVQSPIDESKILASIELSAGSISTSGSYERYFSHNNKQYTHIINPKTGFPVENEVLSVTVWAKTATDADVWSTVLFVAGFKEGTQMVEKHKKDIGVLWILKDQKICYRDSTLGRVILEK